MQNMGYVTEIESMLEIYKLHGLFTIFLSFYLSYSRVK